MDKARQKALDIRDELIVDFLDIKQKFPKDFEDKPLQKLKKRKNGIYEYKTMPQSFSWTTSAQGERWLEKADNFLDYLTTLNENDNKSKTVDEIIDECYIILRGETKNGEKASIDISLCSIEAFVILIIRDCMHANTTHIARANNWTVFVKKYTKYIMG